MARPLVPDALWAELAPLLPPRPPRPKGGRPRVPDRAVLTGILFVLKSGIPWEMLPKEMGCGSGMTCWRRLRDWQQAGIWARLHRILLDRLGRANAIDWSRCALDSAAVAAKRGTPSAASPSATSAEPTSARRSTISPPPPSAPGSWNDGSVGRSKEQPEEAQAFDARGCLSFEYQYPTLLPEGLLPRFIVRTYVLSADDVRWRSGAILHFEGHRALVVADPVERKVRVRIKGAPTGRRRLLAVIRHEFDRIHAGYTFKPQAMIPVPGHPHDVVPYDELAVLEANGIREKQHVSGGKVLMLPVKELLDGVDIEGARRASAVRRPADRPLHAFVSYSHKDDRLRAELDTHLKLLQRREVLHLWTDRRITAGMEWKDDIDEKIWSGPT